MSRVGEFDPADNSESETYGFEFSPLLNAGEAIVSTTWEIKVLGGPDMTPTARFEGPAVMQGTASTQRLTGLVLGTTYELTALVVTNQSNTKALVGVVTCES